jgi:hypothetical protein
MSILILKNIQHDQKTGKSGKQFVSCKLIVASKDGGRDTWISGFGSEITKTWRAGDAIDVDVVKNGEYWNFEENPNTKPSPDKTMVLLTEINAKLDLLLAHGSSHTTPTEQNAVMAGFGAVGGITTPPVDDIPEFLR